MKRVATIFPVYGFLTGSVVASKWLVYIFPDALVLNSQGRHRNVIADRGGVA